MTFRLARNFCLSASKWPSLATMYPGRLTQTTSMTASNTSMTRWSNDGCDSWGFFLKTTKGVCGPVSRTGPAMLASRYDVGFVQAIEGRTRTLRRTGATADGGEGAI